MLKLEEVFEAPGEAHATILDGIDPPHGLHYP